MTFDEYLVRKKIDQLAFQLGQHAVYREWAREFEQLHVESFTAQKLFLINKIRRHYPLKEEENVVPPVTSAEGEVKAAKSPKPIMRPKIN